MDRRISSTGILGDAQAAIGGALALLPAVLAVTVMMGFSPENGIISTAIGCSLVAAFGSNKLQLTAPTTSLVVICVFCIHKFGLQGLILAVIFTGLLQVAFGLLRLGKWFYLLPPGLLRGLMAGIALSIIFNSVPALLGMTAIKHADAIGALFSGTVDPVALMIGPFALVILFVWGFVRMRAASLRLVPGIFLVAAALTALIVATGMPTPFFADLMPATMPVGQETGGVGVFEFGLSVLTLFFISTSKTMVTAMALQSVDGAKIDPNRELLVIGMANVICGGFGGPPVAAQLGRSRLILEMGGHSRLTLLGLGLFLVAVFHLFPQITNLLPIPVVTAILIYSAVKLIEPGKLAAVVAGGRSEIVLFAGTTAAVLIAGINFGLVVGLVLVMAATIIRFAGDCEIRVIADREHKRYLIAIKGPLTIFNLPELATTLDAIPNASTAVIDSADLYYIDPACLTYIRNWKARYEQHGNGQVFVEMVDLTRVAEAPVNHRAEVLDEMRGLDRRQVDRSAGYRRRRLDRYLYGSGPEKAALQDIRRLKTTRGVQKAG